MLDISAVADAKKARNNAAVMIPAILTPLLLPINSIAVSRSSAVITAMRPRVSSFGNMSRSMSITRNPMAASAMSISTIR